MKERIKQMLTERFELNNVPFISVKEKYFDQLKDNNILKNDSVP
jgi:hypothetical protein